MTAANQTFCNWYRPIGGAATRQLKTRLLKRSDIFPGRHLVTLETTGFVG